MAIDAPGDHNLDELKGRHSYDERAADVRRKREMRQDNREVIIPPPADMARRLALEADDIAWLMFYFGDGSGVKDPYTYQFTEQQLEMAKAIRSAILYGGDQALAASRGEGKTTLFERLLVKYTLQGVLSFSVLCAATGTLAENSLDTIKTAFEENDRLAADYPEVCTPVRALEGAPSRAHYQLVSGKRLDNGDTFEKAPGKFIWSGQEIVLPPVPGAPSCGAIIATRGLDSAVRGLKRKGRRPQVVGIDDPDTEETARSEDQSRKLEERIDRALAGLGSQTKRVARVMLTTLQTRIAVSYRFTEPTIKPTWKGRRFRFLVKPPERADLWDEYIARRSAALQAFANGTGDDEHARDAHQFYLDNRAAMDCGAVVSNPHRFDPTILPDGSPLEVSALQFYYNEVSRAGFEAVQCELDNEPGEELGIVESGITAGRIQRQLSGYPRRVVPPECIKITRGIDCRKVALHWVVRAWRVDGTGFTIDYGVHEVRGTTYGSDEGVDVALKRAILDYLESYRAHGLTIDRTLIDAGWRTQAVYAACAAAGLGVQPIMGYGQSAGCVRTSFTDISRRSRDRRPGDGWFQSRKGKVWLVNADADRWKAWEHDRWLTAPGKPGVMTLFGEPSENHKRLSADEREHHSYAHHIANEVEIEEPYRGTMRRRWKAKSDNVHYLDASYYANVAANMEGIRLIAGGAVPAANTTATLGAGRKLLSPKDRPRLSAMRGT